MYFYLEVSDLLSIMRRAAVFIVPVHCLDKVSANAYRISGCNVSECIWSASSISCTLSLFVNVPLAYCYVVIRMYHSMNEAILSNGPVLPDAVT